NHASGAERAGRLDPCAAACRVKINRRAAEKGRDRLRETMQGKIALEEHFAIPETLMDSRGYFPDRVWEEVKSRVMDIQDRRLREMDAHGIEMMLLSLNAPAVQAIPDTAKAAEIARKSNDYLAE